MKSVLVSSLLLSLASAAAVTSNAKRVSYDGYKVVRVKATAEVDSIIADKGLPTWAKEHGNIDVLLPPTQLHALDKFSSTVMHEDLGASVAKEAAFEAYRAGSANTTWFNTYHAYNDHLTFLSDLVATYPSQSETFTIGNSLQGRPITGIHFWGASGKNTKPSIVLHATVHAREWITTMTVEYVAYTLLSTYTSNAQIKTLVDKYDFYVIPVVNPDGFVYTQTTDRMWRKNRQSRSGSTCIGTDINRNWPYQWSGAGSSTSPCSETYRGAAAGDTPELKAHAAFITGLANESRGLKLYIDYHSYSQLFMTPYGYSCTAVARNNAVLQSLASGTAAAIRAVFGTRFTTGPICTTIYQVAGGSVDWAYDIARAAYSFTFELRDTGTYGFVLPPAQILPSGQENFEGFKYLLTNMA